MKSFEMSCHPRVLREFLLRTQQMPQYVGVLDCDIHESVEKSFEICGTLERPTEIVKVQNLVDGRTGSS
jgi:hypothetical protein